MRRIDFPHETPKTLSGSLFRLMLVLAAVLVTALLTALLMFGRVRDPSDELAAVLDMQMETFSREVLSVSEETAQSGILLSQDATRLVEKYLAKSGLTFDQLRDNAPALHAVQDLLFEPVRQMLLQSDCSGAFVTLETTVNSATQAQAPSQFSLYLQKDAAGASRSRVILYRGDTAIGKAHGVMPHRKWRLEFYPESFPDYSAAISQADYPLEESYYITQDVVLTGTDQRVVLMTLPVVGTDGTVYGLCGFEMNQRYFQTHFSITSPLPYLTYAVCPRYGSTIMATEGFSSGVYGGYYLAPDGDLTARTLGGRGIYQFTGSSVPYVGVLRQVHLTPRNDPIVLAVLFPKASYDDAMLEYTLQTSAMLLMLLFFAISCCVYFSHRFLSPVLRDLDQLKTDRREAPADSGFQEIDDLFGYLARQDRAHEEALRALEQEKASALSEAARLAYNRKQEVDPAEFEVFLEGIRHLTPTEREIFGYYLQGRTVKEILEIADIKESTLRYHNRNIYSKLGVNSLKQLLRYAAMLHFREDAPAAEQKKS